MTPDCDLLTDFNRRLEGDLAHNAILHHVLLCDIFKEDEIRSRVAPGRDIWKSITGNQNERYHYLPAGKIGDDIYQDCGSEALMALYQLPPLYLDFKRTFTIPTSAVYGAIDGRETRRVALLTGEYLYDLIHRLYSFLSRVGAG